MLIIQSVPEGPENAVHYIGGEVHIHIQRQYGSYPHIISTDTMLSSESVNHASNVISSKIMNAGYHFVSPQSELRFTKRFTKRL